MASCFSCSESFAWGLKMRPAANGWVFLVSVGLGLEGVQERRAYDRWLLLTSGVIRLGHENGHSVQR
jgi:hypothetical protein